MRRSAALIFTMLLVAACGLDLVGVPATPLDDAGAGTDATSSVDAGPPERICPGGDAGCASGLSPEWPLMILSLTGGVCPSNFASREYLFDPKPASDACTCNCAVTAAGTCTTGELRGKLVNLTLDCLGSDAPVVPVTGALCSTLPPGSKGPAFASYTPMAPVGGTCSSSVVTKPGAVTTTTVRACVPATACRDEVCSGAVPDQFLACISRAGEHECPAGPFSNRTLVGASTTLACNGCGPCQVIGTCPNGSLRYYSDPTCAQGTGVGERQVNGDKACERLGSQTQDQNVRGVTFATGAPNSTCQPGAAEPATVGLADIVTFCCR